MRTISYSDARNRLKQVIDQTVEDADVTVITRRERAPRWPLWPAVTTTTERLLAFCRSGSACLAAGRASQQPILHSWRP